MRLANQDFEASVARPSEARERYKELVRQDLQDPSLDALKANCQEVYSEYQGLSHERTAPSAGNR